MMKKILLLVLTFAVAVGSVDAKNRKDGDEVKEPARFRKKYRNISMASQTVTGVGLSEPSKFGFAFNTGRTYVVHPNPIAGMLRIGIDATWWDMTYGNWNVRTEDGNSQWHKIDTGLGVGPAVHVNPVDKLGIHAYFRFNPTFTSMLGRTGGAWNFAGGYANYFTSGATVSYGFFGLGIEARFGGGTLKNFTFDSDEVDLDIDGEDMPDLSNVLNSKKISHKLSGWRAYISFRF